MNGARATGIGRRDWISSAVPACAVFCLAPCKALGEITKDSIDDLQEGTNPFDQELKRPITYRNLMRRRWGDYIGIMKAVSEGIGEETLFELIRDTVYERNRLMGERRAQRAPDIRMGSLVAGFRNPDPDGVFANSNTWDIVEDSEDAFEIRITACLDAEVFLEREAGELGYATVCHADFGTPKGFNPRITLMRDKTIMQGHDYCNHRYVLT